MKLLETKILKIAHGKACTGVLMPEQSFRKKVKDCYGDGIDNVCEWSTIGRPPRGVDGKRFFL
jgi:hypothetical protein